MFKRRIEQTILNIDFSTWFCFGSVIVLGLLMRLASYTGLVASDDLNYSHYAQLMSNLLYLPELHHHAIRYGLLVPVAGIYWLFGVSELTTVLVPLLTSVASILLLMLIGRKLFGFRAGLLAGVLFATFPVQIHYSTILLPECVAEFWVLLALLAYVYSENDHSVILSIVAGISIGLAYLTKEPAVFVAPALVIDALVRRRWQVAVGIAIGLTTIVALEHIYYFALTDDLLFRLHAYKRHTAGGNPYTDLYYRLIKMYPRMMLLPNLDFGIHSIFVIIMALISFFVLKFRNYRLCVLWSVLPWLYLNFGTSSFTYYRPLPVQPRYIEFCYPPLFLLAAAILDQFASRTKAKMVLSVFLVSLVAITGFACGFATRGQWYHADHVKSLRLIVKNMEKQQFNNIRIDGDKIQRRRWSSCMAILSDDARIHSMFKTANASSSQILTLPLNASDEGFESRSQSKGEIDLIIRPDAFGLPYAILTRKDFD